jgi:hypothetical protein
MRIVIVLVMTLICHMAHAEEAKVFGMQDMFTGALKLANSGILCSAFDDNKCWDGKAWHLIYPSGPRQYAKPPAGTVACVAIMKETHDCWDGSNWYHLPSGTLLGMTDFVNGAFKTTPLPANK